MPAIAHRFQQGRIVREVVGDDNKNHNSRSQSPHVLIVEWNLIDLPGPGKSEGDGLDLEVSSSFVECLLEPDLKFVLDWYLRRFHKRIDPIARKPGWWF